MKILISILMVLTFLVGLGLGAIPISLDSHLKGVDYEKIAEAKKIAATLPADAPEQENIKKLEEIPGQTRVFLAKATSVLTAVLGLILIVLSFMNNDKSKLVAYATFGFILLSILVVPSMDGGSYGPANPKTITMICGGSLAIMSILTLVRSQRHQES